MGTPLRDELKRPLRLNSCVRHNQWGRSGAASIVWRLSGRKIEERPGAELWLGAHPAEPSTVELQNSTRSLDSLIAEFPQEILGDKSLSAFGPSLSYLFKLLSIAEPLSIQCHPDKAQAVKLHAQDPKNYPDSNHKPETAVALTPGEALCGFLPVPEIVKNLERAPEFSYLVSHTAIEVLKTQQDDSALKQFYTGLMRADVRSVEMASAALLGRLKSEKVRSAGEEWVLRLAPSFPRGDIGLFHFYLMNHLLLNKGEALCFMPGLLHAYLSGDWIECMACSDNTVRGGLTPKFVDVENLLSVVSFNSASDGRAKPEESVAYRKAYSAPGISDFCLELLEGGYKDSSRSISGAQIVFCLEGSTVLEGAGFKETLSPGQAFLIPAAVGEYNLTVESGLSCRVAARF